MNSTPSSAWHLMAALAQLNQSAIATVPELAQRVAALLADYPAFTQGALIQSEPRTLLATWGLSDKAADKLVPAAADQPLKLPKGWHTVEIGAGVAPTLLAVKSGDADAEIMLLALSAQLQGLWLPVVQQDQAAAAERLDALTTRVVQVQSLEVLTTLIEDAAGDWRLTIVSPAYVSPLATPLTASEPQALLAAATSEALPLPADYRAALGDSPGLIVRIGGSEHPLGVAVVSGPHAARPALRPAAALLTLALAAAFERLQVVQELRRRETIMDSLNHTLIDLAQQLDVEEFLQSVLMKATEMLGATGGVLYFADQTGVMLEARQIYGFSQKYRGARLKRGIGLVGRVAETRQAEVSNDYSSDPVHVQLPDGIQLAALAAVPLYDGDALIGVLSLAHAETGEFSPSDMHLLESFALQTSLALRTARLFDAQRKQARDLYVLYENSQAVNSSFDLHHILERLVSNMQLALNADQMTAWLYHAEQQSFQLEAAAVDDGSASATGVLPTGTVRQIRSETVWSVLSTTQQPVVINNTATDPRINRDRNEYKQRQVRSVLAVPLLVHDTIVGVLIGEVFETTRLWTAAEITLGQTLAGQAASAIGNARSLSDEQRRGVELALLQELSSQLNAGQSASEVLDAIAGGIRKILPGVHLEICLYDTQSERLRTGYASETAGRHFASTSGEYASSEGFTGWLARHRMPLRIGRVDEFRTVRPVRSGSEKLMVSYLGTPMLVGDELIGTLELAASQVERFDPEDERLLAIIASQAAQALRNVRRYEATDEVLRDRVRELTALQRISRELTSTLRLEQLLPAMVSEIIQATGCEHGLVALNDDPEQLNFTVIAAQGYPDDLALDALTQPLFIHSTFEEALRRADAVIIDDLTMLDQPLAWPDVRSLLFAPILYENHIAGAIIATDSRPHAFTHTALDFVRSVSDQAALAIGNSQHFAEQVRQRELLQQRAGLLNEVLEIGNALRADMELNVLLEQIAFSVSEAAGFRVVLFNLIPNDNSEVLRTVTGAGIALTELERLVNMETPVNDVWPLLDPQYRIERAYFVPTDPAATQWQDGDRLIVPLYSTSRELIGTMVVDEPFDHERPTRRTVETLEIFANQAAIAVENVTLFDQRNRQIAELGAVNRISHAATSSLDFPALAREVYEVLREILPVDAYYLGVFNQQLDEVTASFSMEHEQELVDLDRRLLVQGSMLNWIAHKRAPLWLNDFVNDVRSVPELEWVQVAETSEMRSWIGVPLITGTGPVQGVLSIQHTQPNRYTKTDIELLQTIANQVAVAVENSRLYGDTKRQVQELELVNDAGLLTSSTRDLESILKKVYESLKKSLPLDAFYAFIYDDLREDIELKVMVDEDSIEIDTRPEKILPRSPSQWVIKNHKPLLFNDMPVEIKGRFKVRRFGNRKKRVRSWVGVPLLVSDNRSAGLLSIQHYEPNKYTESEQKLLQTIANQVSLAIQNARLFAERERQIDELDALGKIGQLMSASFALDEMLRQTAAYLQQVTRAPIFFMMVYDADKNIVVRSFAIQEGVIASTMGTHGLPPRTGSLSEWVLHNRQPLVIDDTNDAPALEKLNLVPVSNPVEGKVRGPRSWIGVPILARDGAPIGVLSLQDYAVGAFDERTAAFLMSVSSHVSLGIQKVQLFQERDRQIRELETMRRIGQMTSSTLDMNEMMHSIYRVLKDSLPIEGFIVNIYDAQIDMLVYSLLIDRERQVDVPLVRAVRPRSLTEWILRKRQPLLFANLDQDVLSYPDLDPLQHGDGPHAQSWMGVPLVAKSEQPIGVLALEHYEPGQFTEQDLQFLSSVAYQVTLGVQNVRLYEQTEQSLQQLGAEAERLALINHVSNLTAATLDAQVIYDMAVEEMVRATGADGARLVLFDFQTGIGTSRAVYPSTDLLVEIPVSGNATVPWMQQQRRPLILNDIATNPLTESFRTTVQTMGIRRMMLVPLIVKGELIGSVGLDTFNNEKQFTPRDAETCQTIANQISQALENARLFAETERQASVLTRKVGELSVLLEAGQALSSILDPQEVLATLVGLVRRQLQVDTVLLATLNVAGMLVPTASLGLPDEFIGNIQVAPGDGLIGAVAQTREPLAVLDVQSTPPESQYPRFNRRFHLTSFLGVPVLYRKQVIGVLSVMTHNPREFSADDIAFLSALADQAAIALENARLFVERDRQIVMLQALNEVTEAITSTLNRQQLLGELHTQLGKVVDTQYSFIALYERDANELSFPILMKAGQRVEQVPLPLASGVLSRVVREGHTIVLNTSEETADASRLVLDENERIQSWVGVPITSGEQVLGVINIQSQRAYMYTPEIVQFLQSVASQATIALENARLFSERERDIAQAEILSAVGRAVTATVQPEALIASVLEGIAGLVDVSNAYVALYDAPSSLVLATYGLIDGEPFIVPSHQLENDFLKTVLFEQQPLLLPTLEAQQAEGITPQLDDLPDGRTMIVAQSVAAVPITMGTQTTGMHTKQPLGVIALLSEQPAAFSSEQLRFLEAVADQSSNAVQRTMLFAERERRLRELDTLNRISQAITSTIDLDDILSRLHAGLSEIVDMSSSFIGLYNSATNTMHYEQAQDSGKPLKFAPAVLGINVNSWVIENRQPLLLNTAEEADEYRDQAARERIRINLTRQGLDTSEQSYLVVPIIVGNDVLGVINIQSYEQYAFSDYDMSFVSTVAAQAAASIANARLFDARERSIQQLRTLSTIGQALGSTVRYDDLLRVIYEQAGKLVDTRNFFLALYDERRDEVAFPLFYEHGKQLRVEAQRHGNGLTEYVIRNRQPLTLQGSAIREQMEGLGVDLVGELALSWIGIPMIAADKVVGVLSIQDFESSSAYDDDAIQLLTTVANQAAQALENARLFSESRESVRELSTLSDTSVSLASTLDIDELMVISASNAIEMSRADFGGVIIIDPNNEAVSHSLLLDGDISELTMPLNTADISSFRPLRPLRQGQNVTVFDSAVEESLSEMTRPLGIRGAVFLPMMRDGLRGVVFVGMRHPHTFEDRSISSLQILTTQISQAINNAQLFEQIRDFNTELEAIVAQRTQALADANAQITTEKERVESLYNIATELGTTLDRSELLVRTLDLSAKSLNVNRGTVLMLDRESNHMTAQAVLNEEIGLRALEAPVVFEQGDGLANWVLTNSEGVVIDDVFADERWITIETGRGSDVRSVIAVPLFSSDQPQGVLMLYSPQMAYFTGDHLRFLSTIAGEVSSALHNADLYNLVYDSADRLSDAMWQQREQASRTTAILQSISEGVIMLDHESGMITLYNPAAEQVLRLPHATVINQTLQAFAVPFNEDEQHEQGRALELYSGLSDGIQLVQQHDGYQSSIIELPGQPGQIIAANFAPVSGDTGMKYGVVIVLRDITREVEADRAKRDFIATVSHELRTPLTPIRGFVDLLLIGAVGALSDVQRETLNTIKANTMRMVSLVEDLLEIGRLEAGRISLNLTPSNINQLVRDTLAMWQNELTTKNMQLELSIDEGLPLIEYDGKRIGQVFTNLLSNAIKYSYEGGMVRIHTHRNADGLIQVDVGDTGVGLKPEDLNKLFQRFYRADSPLREQAGGTGLGLSIARSFIELHNGAMWVQSVYGEGSTFSFTLPEQQPRPDLGPDDDSADMQSVQSFEETTS